MQNYFEIRNLKCSYKTEKSKPKKVVLEIEKLDIPKGKIVFIVGKSGCGKSTILETLGLMNNTVDNPNEAKFTFFTPEEKEENFIEIWNKKSSELSDIRKKYFSFIFQQTNLMKNFTIWENAVIPQLIKGGNKKYKDVLEQVELKEILDEGKRNVSQLAGGQQQRLAFVRAIMPSFNIVFGDEPTGNLDPNNAVNLIKIIADEIAKDNTKTAIIVSHSPELSTKYADIIIKIRKDKLENDESCGIIDSNSVYEKRDEKWFQNQTELTEEELQIKIKE